MTLIVTGHRSLAELETIINRGARAFIEVGNALTEIRDRKLYKSSFKTFESYCRDRWGFSKKNAYHLIDATAVIKQLPKVLSSEIKNARQARCLSTVPEPQRQAVLHAAIETAQKECRPMTGRDISEHAEKLNPKPDPDPLSGVQYTYMPFREFSEMLSGLVEKFEGQCSVHDRRRLAKLLKTISQRLES